MAARGVNYIFSISPGDLNCADCAIFVNCFVVFYNLKQVSAATLFCCEALEMFCGLTKLHLTSHQHVSEGMMTELSCVGVLFL